MKRSELLNWNKNDFIKGLVMTIFAAVLTAIYNLVEMEGFDWTHSEVIGVAKVAALAGMAYLLKNLITNSDGKIARKEAKKVIEED